MARTWSLSLISAPPNPSCDPAKPSRARHAQGSSRQTNARSSATASYQSAPPRSRERERERDSEHDDRSDTSATQWPPSFDESLPPRRGRSSSPPPATFERRAPHEPFVLNKKPTRLDHPSTEGQSRQADQEAIPSGRRSRSPTRSSGVESSSNSFENSAPAKPFVLPKKASRSSSPHARAFALV